MKIQIPKEQSNYLEMLTYEVQCHQDLLTFMAAHGIDKNISQNYYEACHQVILSGILS